MLRLEKRFHAELEYCPLRYPQLTVELENDLLKSPSNRAFTIRPLSSETDSDRVLGLSFNDNYRLIRF